MDALRATRVRRNGGLRLAGAISTLGAVLSLVAIPFTNASERGTPLALAGLFVHGVILFGATWLGWHYAKRDAVSLAVRNGGLSIDNTVARAWTGGEAIALPDGRAQVDLTAGLRRERLEVSGMNTARELLAALGLDRRAGTSQFYPRIRVRPAAFVVAGAFFFAALPMFAFLGAAITLFAFGLAALAALVGLFQWFRSSVEMTVGLDGLEIRQGWNRRFLPYARIQSVHRVDTEEAPWRHDNSHVSLGFRVTTDDGASTVYDTRAERFRGNVWRTDPIFDAVEKAWQRGRAKDRAPQAAALALARGPRSSQDWIAALRAQGRSERADYRVAALDSRALFDVLVDPAATRELRAAAAVALAASDEHAPRLRVAADDVADDVVRRVALAAAEEDDARLAEALEEAAGPRARATAR